MKHRIFIAINLPEEVKTSLADYQNKWSRPTISLGRGSSTVSGQELPARWTKPENIHITLVFIGDVDKEGIPKIKQVIKKVIVRQKSFSAVLDKILYSPYKKDKESPRMIWAMGQLSEEFLNLKKDLEKELSEKIRFSPEKREATLHITIARIKKWEWRRIEPDERPEIEEYINLSFEVKSIELMESKLKRSGSEYTILESFPLG